MSTNQKADTARRNGAKSKGPKSASGKAASSRNALKHGRYSSTALESAIHRAVAPHEDKERFLRLARRNLEQLCPNSAFERDLAIAIADTQWRYERWNHAETHLLGAEFRDVCETFDDQKAGGYADLETTTDELYARAARKLACGGEFLKRITAERTRLIRERAHHLRLLRLIQSEYPKASKRTKERTKERTNVFPFPEGVSC